MTSLKNHPPTHVCLSVCVTMTYLGTVEHARGLLIEDDGLSVEVGRHPRPGHQHHGHQEGQHVQKGAQMCVPTVCEEGGGIGGAREVDCYIRDWFHSVRALLPGPDDISRPRRGKQKLD